MRDPLAITRPPTLAWYRLRRSTVAGDAGRVKAGSTRRPFSVEPDDVWDRVELVRSGQRPRPPRMQRAIGAGGDASVLRFSINCGDEGADFAGPPPPSHLVVQFLPTALLREPAAFLVTGPLPCLRGHRGVMTLGRASVETSDLFPRQFQRDAIVIHHPRGRALPFVQQPEQQVVGIGQTVAHGIGL